VAIDLTPISEENGQSGIGRAVVLALAQADADIAVSYSPRL